MKSKLNLDPKIIESARLCAAGIAADMQKFIDRHTTVSTERTVVRRRAAQRGCLLDRECHDPDRAFSPGDC